MDLHEEDEKKHQRKKNSGGWLFWTWIIIVVVVCIVGFAYAIKTSYTNIFGNMDLNKNLQQEVETVNSNLVNNWNDYTPVYATGELVTPDDNYLNFGNYKINVSQQNAVNSYIDNLKIYLETQGPSVCEDKNNDKYKYEITPILNLLDSLNYHVIHKRYSPSASQLNLFLIQTTNRIHTMFNELGKPYSKCKSSLFGAMRQTPSQPLNYSSRK